MKSKRWLDPRLLIGVVLVAASIASVAFVVTQSNRTIEVWVASGPVGAGETLAAQDVALARVQLESADLYHQQNASPVGKVVTQSLVAGELIPRSAVVDEAIAATAQITVPILATSAADFGRGDIVDVWSAEPAEDRSAGYRSPKILVDNAVIVDVHQPEGLLSTSNEVQVELLIPAGDTTAALDAVTNRHALHLVPDPVPGA